MKKFMVFIFFVSTILYAQKLEISDFQTDVYSKSSKATLKKVNLSMILIGRYVEEESYKIVDALNVVIGSFFAEDLFTSRGKEGLKKGLISYTSKKYGLEIDDVFIKKIYVINFPKTDEIIEALKKEGCCQMGYDIQNKDKNPPNSLPKLDGKDNIIIVD